jgi:UbiD family decarboxylase
MKDLRTFIQSLEKERDIVTINAPVNPHLEAAEIHRRVIESGGPALIFKNISGARYPLITNLFGTKKRVDLAFGSKPEEIIRQVASLPHECLPPTLPKLWKKRSLFMDLARVGMRTQRDAPTLEVVDSPARLTELPLLTTWKEDGGAFITLPLVYTQHPTTHIPNLGMYRLQRFDDQTTGFHCQIGKGAGFHLAEARARNEPLPVNVFLGGPPALILGAIAPLPENVPELLLTSLVLGKKLSICKNPCGPLPVVADAEFTLVGEVHPHELRPEGPFGDHYGYYSLKHDYPVFRVKTVLRRKDPYCVATVVGKPRQEDFFIGDYLQELLSPLFPLVMPTVKDLWSYGETGYHSLAAAVVQQRYKRESMVSAFRILGEGQLALTKFLLLTDTPMNLRDFPRVLEHILARADFRTDLYVFSNLSMDTLDYTGPKVNEGSKGVLIGTGPAIRELPAAFSGELPRGFGKALPFCKGCLVVEGSPYAEEPNATARLASVPALASWPLVILVDNAEKAVATTMSFLWTTFTRFEPGNDITAQATEVIRNHISYTPPIVIDARMKPGYPDELFCDDETKELVDRRWKEYGV